MEKAGAIAPEIFDDDKYRQDPYLDKEKPLPFEEIYLAFVEVAMATIEEEIALSPEKNQPFGENLDTSIDNYIEELITGFEQMYCFLQARRELLLSSDSPLKAFAREKVRFTKK